MINNCPECGSELNGNYSQCPECGALISKVSNLSQNSDNKENLREKNLSKGIFVLFAAIIFAGAAVIILSSNILDKPKPPASFQHSHLDHDDDLIIEITKLKEELSVRNDPELVLKLANLQSDAGLYEDAINSYQNYLDKNPENADARIDMGIAYFNLQNYSLALKEMERALKYEPGHQIGHLNLGIVNLQSGNLEISKDWLRKAVELDKNSEAGKRAAEILSNHF